MDERVKFANERYMRACHAMQSGVAAKMHVARPTAAAETESKHLRVGVNSAMVDSSALAKLLMDKGVINEAEYCDAIATAMEEEVRRYEEFLAMVYGRKITLA